MVCCIFVRFRGPAEEGNGAELVRCHSSHHLHVTGVRASKTCGGVLEKLAKAETSVYFAKSLWCCLQKASVGMAVGRFGVRPSQSKIEAATQASRATTVEKVWTLLGMAEYLRRFVPVQCFVALICGTNFGYVQRQTLCVK